jgi:hypothetical protein
LFISRKTKLIRNWTVTIISQQIVAKFLQKEFWQRLNVKILQKVHKHLPWGIILSFLFIRKILFLKLFYVKKVLCS